MSYTTRTKQINVYGKRSRRVVRIADENAVTPVRGYATVQNATRSDQISTIAKEHIYSPPRRLPKKHVARLSNSPLHSPFHRMYPKKAASIYPKAQGKSKGKAPATPFRQPFGDVLNSPQVKRRIMMVTPPIVSEEEEEEELPIKPPILGVRHKPIVIESDEETPELNDYAKSLQIIKGSKKHPIVLSPDLSPSGCHPTSTSTQQSAPSPFIHKPGASKENALHDFQQVLKSMSLLSSPSKPQPNIHIFPTALPITQPGPISTLAKPAPTFSPRLTRTRSRAILNTTRLLALTSPLRPTLLPSRTRIERTLPNILTIDKDVCRPTASTRLSRPPPSFEQILQPLLSVCQQSEPLNFESFVSTFVSANLSSHDPYSSFHSKIGEATYSEVFGCGEVVLKIIPLRNPRVPPPNENSDDDDDNWPTESDIPDVVREIITTRALGNSSEGFVKLIRSYVIKGLYPKKLLKLWDAFKTRKGTENIRPDCFGPNQHYAVIVLPNGGPDLESYDFKTSKVNAKQPWRKAWSIFWQVSRALQRAEKLVEFEHRDLHWGQILVKDIATDSISLSDLEYEDAASLSSGVQVTIIDLGLARMDGGEDQQRWSEFDPLIFEGQGDYQYDVYRMMNAHNGGEWSTYHPLTNVMWLHYLAMKLLRSKHLRIPAKLKSSSGSPLSERACYDNLTETEKLLGENVKTRKCRLKEKRIGSAGDLWKYGVVHGWVHDR